MNKDTQTNKSYNPVAVHKLAKKHGFSTRYIRECLRGGRQCITADTINKDYKRIVNAINKII